MNKAELPVQEGTIATTLEEAQQAQGIVGLMIDDEQERQAAVEAVGQGRVRFSKPSLFPDTAGDAIIISGEHDIADDDIVAMAAMQKSIFAVTHEGTLYQVYYPEDVDNEATGTPERYSRRGDPLKFAGKKYDPRQMGLFGGPLFDDDQPSEPKKPAPQEAPPAAPTAPTHDASDDPKDWQPYTGAKGGRGWINTATGEVRYQDEKPGAEKPEKDDEPKEPKSTKPSVPEGDQPKSVDMKFPTAAEAAMAGKSHAEWTGAISDAFVQEKIDEDHPAWQSIQSENIPFSVDDYNRAKNLYGSTVRAALPHKKEALYGEVTGINDDMSIQITDKDGKEHRVSADYADDLEAYIAHQEKRGRDATEARSHLPGAGDQAEKPEPEPESEAEEPEAEEPQGEKLTGLAHTYKDAGRRLATGERVEFIEGEHKGMTASVINAIRPEFRAEEVTYRLQVDGFPKPGGWDGKITATAKMLEAMAVKAGDEPEPEAPAEEPAEEPAAEPEEAWEPEGESKTFGPKQLEVRQDDNGQWWYQKDGEWIEAGEGFSARLEQLHGDGPVPVDGEQKTLGNVEDLDNESANPRQQAAAATTKAMEYDSEYAWARKSSIGNAGEDLLGSARHTRNAWRSLEEAEADGTAEQLVTKANLAKNEPHRIMSHVDHNPITSLAMHLAFAKFPGKPKADKGRRGATEEDQKAARAQYVEAYRELKTLAEDLAENEQDVQGALNKFSTAIRDKIKELRKGDYYNGVANSLVSTYNGVVKKWRPGKTHVMYAMAEFTKNVDEHHDEATHGDKSDYVIDKIKDVVEGKSVNKAFGVTKEGKQRFKPSDMYVKIAERKGGPEINAHTTQQAMNYMVNDLGMRGVQWGNSVTDDERHHHAQMASGAMADLMDIVGLPPEMASLGGKLGLAIGARGRGGALAHYEPATKVINLTRKNGVGSLAHEWGHFFDHHAEGTSYKGDKLFSQNYRPAIEHYKDEDGTWKKRRKEDAGPMQAAYTDLFEAMSSSGYNARLSEALRAAKRVMAIDMDYYKSKEERFARCFERYVQKKLEDQGRKNTYLAGIETKSYKQGGFWPTDDEVDALTPHFDAIFAAYRNKIDTTEGV